MSPLWPPRLPKTLGLRIAAWYAAVFLLTSVSVGLFAYQWLKLSLEHRDHDLLVVKLAEYSDLFDRGGIDEVSRAVAAEQVAGSLDSVMVRLVSRGADVLLVSMPPAWRTYDLSQLDLLQPPDNGDDWQQVPSRADATTLEVVSRPIGRGATIQVGRTTLEREQFLKQVRDLLGVMLLTVIAGGLAGGVALTRSALRPLRELRDTVRTVARTGRLDTRVDAESAGHGDMVDELGQVFNIMLARIEALVAGMRGALDTVAHDLRTPVARLRARAELGLGPNASDADRRDALAACVEEADNVASLLTTLMDISEADAGVMRLALAPTSVDTLFDDTIDLYEDAAEDRGVSLARSSATGFVVQGDRQRLRQALANLVDNALKYTPAGGSVNLDAVESEDAITIVVSDTGTGIAEVDLPRIWDRLYRGSDAPEHSLGLGLSLVRAIVIAHGGRVDVTSEAGRGAAFRITLPRPTQA